MDVVDTHPHVISDDSQKYPTAPLYGRRSDWSNAHPITTEQYLAHMDTADVAQAALVHSSTTYGFDNSYAADSVAKYPDRFAGVCSVDAEAPDGAEKLRYWIEERGMHGLRLYTGGSTAEGRIADFLNKPVSYPVWEEAGRLGISVAVQLRWPGLSMLRNVLERFPNVNMLLDHFGSAPIEEGAPYSGSQPLFDLATYPNLYLKFSTRNIRQAGSGQSTVKDWFGKVIDTFGANRIMWGSNFPGAWGAGPKGPYRELVDFAREQLSVLGKEDQRWLLAKSARSVYPSLRTKVRA
jgi:L-fuconolactonase